MTNLRENDEQNKPQDEFDCQVSVTHCASIDCKWHHELNPGGSESSNQQTRFYLGDPN